MNSALEQLIRIAAEAADVVSEVYTSPFSVDWKAPSDPVTEADRRANDLICERLAETFPGVPVVAEESEPASFSGYREKPQVFFVDPLDGTREFVDKNGEFVVMIGLLDGNRPTLGVVHAPARGVAWAAAVGSGAFRIAADGARTPLAPSRQSVLKEARVVASRSHRTENVEQALAVLGVRELIALGSAGLKGAEVASGGAEAYVAPLSGGKRWDSCAAEALVTAAGGRVTDAWGVPIDYRGASLSNDRGLVLTNGLVHDALLERLDAWLSAHGIRPS
jgi:3'(2'), 5'-bisphosphate nucleotidase